MSTFLYSPLLLLLNDYVNRWIAVKEIKKFELLKV